MRRQCLHSASYRTPGTPVDAAYRIEGKPRLITFEVAATNHPPHPRPAAATASRNAIASTSAAS
jgi:hypothetical protein